MVKRKWIKELVGKNRPAVIGIQETKTKTWNKAQVIGLWGGDEVDFVHSEARGNLGGLITMWDKRIFNCTSKYVDPSLVVTIGTWEREEGLIGLINVYGPNSLKERLEIWSKIEEILEIDGVSWCMFGDFNEVRSERE